MQLENDFVFINKIDDIIQNYYKKNGNRFVVRFMTSENKEWGSVHLHYLIDRRHVIRYGIGEDRGCLLGGVDLAIGPSYFTAADFWSYENFERFSLEVNIEGIERNLNLLDEFLNLGQK